MLSPEQYVLLAPGLMIGRLSAEPWLAIVGIVIGVASPRWWLALLLSVAVGSIWGLISIGFGGEAPLMLESAYLASLPIAVVALVTYFAKRAIRARKSVA